MKVYTFDEIKNEILDTDEKKIEYKKTLREYDFGDLLQLIRKDKKISRNTLSLKSGVSVSQITKIEANFDNVTVNTLFKVFAALGYTVKINIENKR